MVANVAASNRCAVSECEAAIAERRDSCHCTNNHTQTL